MNKTCHKPGLPPRLGFRWEDAPELSDRVQRRFPAPWPCTPLSNRCQPPTQPPLGTWIHRICRSVTRPASLVLCRFRPAGPHAWLYLPRSLPRVQPFWLSDRTSQSCLQAPMSKGSARKCVYHPRIEAGISPEKAVPPEAGDRIRTDKHWEEPELRAVD